MDFTIMQDVDKSSLKQGFEEIFLSINKKSSIAYSFSAFNAGEYAIFADVQFLGPIGFKNKIAHDISLKEKMVEKPLRMNVKPEYEDFPARIASWVQVNLSDLLSLAVTLQSFLSLLHYLRDLLQNDMVYICGLVHPELLYLLSFPLPDFQ
jgi:hypothetical protein